MERDFLGFSSKKSYEPLKEEASDESKIVPRSSNSDMQWSFSNKDSEAPQFLSFTAYREEMPTEGVCRTSSFLTTSTADVFNSSQKSFSGAIQKKFIHEKQAGNHYGMKVHPKQHREANQPLLTPLSSVPSKTSVVGTTDLRKASNSSRVPAQLTIFYAGAVNVYHDTSPEKAQAIMSLAGHGSSPATARVETTFPIPSTGDLYLGNQSYITSSISGLASPISVPTHATAYHGGAFGSRNALRVSKPVATSVSLINQKEHSDVVAQSFMTNLIRAVPVPQARKASLARFFEKRKERMTGTLPYNLISRKSPNSSTSGSDALSFSLNLSSSSPFQATN